MPETKKQKFSIVIPCVNEEDYIGNCLDSIIQQDYDKELIEVVIVDGISTDKTTDIVKEYQKKHSGIKLYSNPEKRTPVSLNIGIKKSAGDVVIILGAHTRLDSEFIKLNNKYLIEKDVKVTGGTQKNVGNGFMQQLIGLVMEMPFGMASAQYRWSRKEQFVDTVVYAAYKKELFDEVGLFEENFTIAEDAEINWRIRNAGHKIFYSPKIKSYYYPRNSIKRFLKQMFRYGILRVNVLKKHFNSLKLIHLIPSAFVLAILGLAVAGFFNPLLFKFLLILLGAHILSGFIAAMIKTFSGKLLYLPAIPLLLLFMHIAWGLGFLIGAVLPKSDKW